MSEVAVYFDFLSPYAYLGWRAARERFSARGVDLVPRPVVFAALLAAGGQRGPAEIPAKRRFVIRDCLRLAQRQGVPLVFPARHPFRSLEALRLCLPEVAGQHQLRLIDALFDAAWLRGEELGDEPTLRAVVQRVGLDAEIVDSTRAPAVKAALRQATDRAIAAGVFGVPSFEVAGEIVWGHDRLDDVLALLDGGLAIDEGIVAACLAQPPGVTRRSPAALDPAIEARVRAIVDDAPFVRHLGIVVEGMGAGWVETSLAVRDEHLQQDGVLHAGVAITLADHSAGAAAGTLAPEGRTPLSAQVSVNLLRPGRGRALRCRATVIRGGGRLSVCEAEVWSGEEAIARATVTLALVARR